VAVCTSGKQPEIQRFELYAGGQHDTQTLENIIPFLPQNSYVTADRGYDSKKIRRKIRYQGAKPLIPRRRQKKGKARRTPKPVIYKQRWQIEQAFSRYDQFRKLTVRNERDPWSYKAWWYAAGAFLKLKKLTG
jgi:hypothetical protein